MFCVSVILALAAVFTATSENLPVFNLINTDKDPLPRMTNLITRPNFDVGLFSNMFISRRLTSV